MYTGRYICYAAGDLVISHIISYFIMRFAKKNCFFLQTLLSYKIISHILLHAFYYYASTLCSHDRSGRSVFSSIQPERRVAELL